jgi:hypothetical protein
MKAVFRNVARNFSSFTFAAMEFTISLARAEDSCAPAVSPNCDLRRARPA